jgi:predicted ATPase
MLSRICVDNYNCFVDFRLDLPGRLVIVGSNGSGKTSLWEVLAALQDVIVRGVDVATAFPTRTLTRWKSTETLQRFGLDVTLGEDAYLYQLEITHDSVRQLPSIRLERLTFGEQTLYEIADGEVRLFGDVPSTTPRAHFPFGRKRSFLPDLELRRENRRTVAFRDAVADFWLLAPSSRRIEPTSASEAPWLSRDGQNFASWFRSALQERAGIGTELLDALRPVMPGLRDLGIVSISKEVRELMLSFRVEGSEAYRLSVSELSDGQRSLLVLYGFLLGALDHASLAFLDEPEMGLAPHEIQPWLSEMSKTLDAHDGQALVISHHPAVVDYLAPANAVRFSRPGGGPARAQEVTLDTTGGTSVSEWISRPWAYDDEAGDAQRP